MLDINKLTIGEVATVEQISGLSLTAMTNDDSPKARMLIGMAFVLRKRDEPKVKVSEIEAMTLTEINALLGEGDGDGGGGVEG